MSLVVINKLREWPVTVWVLAHLCVLAVAVLLLPGWFDVVAGVAAVVVGLRVVRWEAEQRHMLAAVRDRVSGLFAGAAEAPATMPAAVERLGELLKSGRARVDATETKYRTLVDQAAVAVYVHDGENFLDVNRRACELLGYPRAELLALPVCEVMGAPSAGETGAAFSRLPAGRQPDRQAKHRRRDGTRVPVEVSTTVVHIDGRPTALSIVRDITERLHIEQARDRSRERLQLVADNIPSLVALVDIRQRYQFVNRAYARWFERFDRDLVGRAVKDVLDEATYRDARPHIERALSGLTAVFQHAIYDREGRACHFLATYVPHRESGKVVGFVALEHDITELENAAQRVRESEARYRQLVESSPYCIHEIDPDGVLRSVNSAGLRMLGKRQVRDLVGRNLLQCAAPEEHEAVRAHIHEALAGGSAELEYRTADGRTFASTMTMLHDVRDRGPGLVGIIRDITGQKRVEARRREAEEEGRRHLESMKALSARLESVREEERKHVSREIHDELGQLLTGLKMELHGLENAVMRLPEEVARAAMEERIIEAGDLADRTISAVREIAMRIRPSVLDELGLIPALRHECARYEERTGIRCEFSAASDFPGLEDEEATTFFRLAQEFLTNIARHAKATRATVRLAREENRLTLRVTDDGVGIPEDAESTSGHLGLVGARERVHNHGGTLTLDGLEGSGSVVTVRLPLPSKSDLPK